MTGFFAATTVAKSSPPSTVARCGACGLYKTCQSPKMTPYGRGRKSVMIVGEAPGETEDEMGRPFVGKAGKYLRDVARGLGVNLDEDTVITNSVICRPPRNATPEAKQIESCHPFLVNALEQHNPQVVITLGRSALSSLLLGVWDDIDALERWVGWKIPMGRFWLCPTYHPSYLLRMRNPAMDRSFAVHLESAFEIQSPPRLLEGLQEKVTICYDDKRAADMLNRIVERAKAVAVDYETNCLKPEYPDARIYSCAVSDGMETISYPWQGEAIEATQRLLASPQPKIASNLKFEERWTRHTFGHGVRNWDWDTMLAAHCLDNRQGICSIKFQSFILAGVPAYNRTVEPFLVSKGSSLYNRIGEIAWKDLLLYGGLDAYLERYVARLQRQMIMV